MKVLKQGTYGAFYDMPLEVNWILTDMCNYSCSYCFGQKKIDVERFSKWEELQAAVENIRLLNRSSYTVSLSGGEPTIHPHYFELINLIHDKLGDKLDHFVLISNGSRQENLYSQIAEVASSICINLIISIHTEFVDTDHIVQIIKTLSDKVYIRFNLMMNPELFERVKSIYDTLILLRTDYPFDLAIQTLRAAPNYDIPDQRYSKEQLDWQKEAQENFKQAESESSHICRWKSSQRYFKWLFEVEDDDGKIKLMDNYNFNQYFHKGLLGFEGMHCILGTGVLNIEYDGRCRGAVCKAAKYKGNIFKENPYDNDEFIEDIICPMKNCGCAPNHLIPKFLSDEEAQYFTKIYKIKQKRTMQNS